MPSIRSEPTPNPNSLKFTADHGPFVDRGMESFSSAEEAEGHALGERLFAISGVDNVFIMPQFVTVSKTPAADWAHVSPKVEAALSDHLADNTDARADDE